MIDMVKVYKTNVDKRSKAKAILDTIRKTLPGSDPSFDLEDCDKVLRVEYPGSDIDEHNIRQILQGYGYDMEKLL